MKNLAFVVWMLGWPLVFVLTSKITLIQSDLPSGTVSAFVGLWFCVGFLLYE